MMASPVSRDLKHWPVGGLERLESCPLCGSSELTTLHTDLQDKTFYSAPGNWTLEQCVGCKAAILNPRPSLETIHLAYGDYYTHDAPASDEAQSEPSIRRRIYNDYLKHRFGLIGAPTTPLGRFVVLFIPGLKAALDTEFRYLPRLSKEHKRVLDLGCGDGSWLALARRAGWKVFGAEPDPAARAISADRGLDVREGGIEQWADEVESFDSIVMSHVIEHVHDPLKVFQTSFRLLRPGGQLFVDTPNLDALGHTKYGRNWRGLEPPRHLVIFNASALREALIRSGFERIRIVPRPQPFQLLSRVSACIEKGIPYMPDLDNANLRLPTRIERVRARFTRRHQEFLTVTCIRPTVQSGLEE